MLRDAAVLQLNLAEAALEEEITLKDATPYNLQYANGGPIFIDLLSFEPLTPGEPWAGYRQFCEMFLFPLLLQAYRNVDFQPLLRARIDGIDVQTMARLVGLADLFKSGIFTHVWLQATLDRKYGSEKRDVRTDIKRAGFSKELILVNLRKMRKLINGLAWQPKESEWGNYEDLHNYSDADLALKKEFVRECVLASGAKCVCDLGCNAGVYSKIAAGSANTVIAMDFDHLAVERLYLETKRSGLKSILPLVQNVTDPSPNWGWRLSERVSIQQRTKPDLILCLALLHHVVISANVPLAEFIAWLADFNCQLIIEFVSRSDEKVKALLLNKEDRYTDYSRKSLEHSLNAYFRVIKQVGLESGNRHIYWCEPGAIAS